MLVTGNRQVVALTALLLAACGAEPVANEVSENIGSADAVAAAPANVASPTPAAPKPQPAARYRFTGTEPFWGGTIDGTTILYQTPEDQAGKTITTRIAKEGPTTRYSGELDGQPSSSS